MVEAQHGVRAVIFENKLGLINSVDLDREGKCVSKKKIRALFDTGIWDKLEIEKLVLLQAIHNNLFDEIYDVGGKTRTANLTRDNFCSAPIMYLQVSFESIKTRCRNLRSMRLSRSMRG